MRWERKRSILSHKREVAAMHIFIYFEFLEEIVCFTDSKVPRYIQRPGSQIQWRFRDYLR